MNVVKAMQIAILIIILTIYVLDPIVLGVSKTHQENACAICVQIKRLKVSRMWLKHTSKKLEIKSTKRSQISMTKVIFKVIQVCHLKHIVRVFSVAYSYIVYWSQLLDAWKTK